MEYLKPEHNPKFYNASCAGKVPYPSEEAANTVAVLAKRGKLFAHRNNKHNPLGIEAYLCEFSDPNEPHWHLGHS